MAYIISDVLIASAYWIPFVLAIGVIFSYMNVIDISVDGVIVISGIVTVIVWNITGNFWVSLFSAALIGGIGSGIFGSLIHLLKINNLIAGIIYSLFCYSLSVLLIGESIKISDNIFYGDGHGILGVMLLDLFILVFVFWFYSTRIGVLIKGISDRPELKVKVNKNYAYIFGHVLCGVILGLGAGFYVSWEGLARAGGGFDFLLTGLTSYLVSERLFDLINARLHFKKSLIESFLSSIVVRVVVGTFFFQLFIYLIIYYSPFPQIWKMLFSVLLFVSLVKVDIKRKKYSKIKDVVDNAYKEDSMSFENIVKVFYDIGDKYVLFDKSAFVLKKGLNVLVGDNGTGKSTLIKCINGDESLTSGKILFNGYRIDNVFKDERPVFILRQNPHKNLANKLFIYENIDAVVNGSYRPLTLVSFQNVCKQIKKKIIKIFDEVDESILKRKASMVSGGEAQYLSFLMAAMVESTVILADEPTANLDIKNKKLVINLLSELSEEKILIVATHDKELISKAATIIKINNKEIKIND